MKKIISFSALLLLTAIVYWGCKKNNDVAALNGTNNMAAYNALVKQIADAKAFFISHVDTNMVQKFKKTALWEKAYIAHIKTGDQVIVPLKYDKNYTFVSSFGGGNKLSLEAQSHLTVYKTASGNYKTEIINYMPDESFLNKTVSSFSGFVSASDWADNIIEMRKYVNGQVTPMQKKNIVDHAEVKSGPNAEDAFEEDCSDGYTNYYWCDNGWNSIGDCTYLFSVCNDVESLVPDGGGSGITVDDNMNVLVTKLWHVQQDPYGFWDVLSAETVNGVKSFTHPYDPKYNYFTSISPGSSHLENSYNDINGNPLTYGYIQDSHGTSFSAQSIAATASGHFSKQAINTSGAPVGSPSTQTVSGTVGWGFSDCF